MNKEIALNNPSPFRLRAYSKKELAYIYGVSSRVLRGWFAAHPELNAGKHRKTFSVLEVEAIFKTFGKPRKLDL